MRNFQPSQAGIRFQPSVFSNPSGDWFTGTPMWFVAKAKEAVTGSSPEATPAAESYSWFAPAAPAAVVAETIKQPPTVDPVAKPPPGPEKPPGTPWGLIAGIGIGTVVVAGGLWWWMGRE